MYLSYLRFRNGRETPDQDYNRHFPYGPVIGPVSVRWVYGNIQLNGPGSETFVVLPVVDDLFKIKDAYYSDMEIWEETDPDLRALLADHEVPQYSVADLEGWIKDDDLLEKAKAKPFSVGFGEEQLRKLGGPAVKYLIEGCINRGIQFIDINRAGVRGINELNDCSYVYFRAGKGEDWYKTHEGISCPTTPWLMSINHGSDWSCANVQFEKNPDDF